MSLVAYLLLLAFGALAVRFTVLGALVSRRGSRPIMLGLIAALILFDTIEFIARWHHH